MHGVVSTRYGVSGLSSTSAVNIAAVAVAVAEAVAEVPFVVAVVTLAVVVAVAVVAFRVDLRDVGGVSIPLVVGRVAVGFLVWIFCVRQLWRKMIGD